MNVRSEKTHIIDPDAPLWYQCQQWNELVSMVRCRIIRCVMIWLPPKLGVVNDPGAELRGFLVHECKMFAGMLPTRAQWIAFGQPMNADEIKAHIDVHGKNSHPVIFTEDGQYFTRIPETTEAP